MSLKIRRGLESDRLLITPEEGEFLYTTDEKKVYIGDNITVGGNPVSIGELNVQVDWNQTDSNQDDFIKNKPSTFTPISHTHTSSEITDFQNNVTANANVTANTAARHTHSNKVLLDSYAQTEVDLADAVSKKHTHSNISILNAITESFTTVLKTAYDSTVTWISTNGTNLLNHLTNTSNPHSVTKTQVGLSNVDNTSDLNKPISTVTQTALNNKANITHIHVETDITDLDKYTQSETDTLLSDKVDKVVGKQLSEEDYTTTEKTKLSGIEVNAQVNVNADWNAISGDAEILNKPTIPSIAGLATAFYVDTQDNLKVDKVAGSRLITSAEATLLGDTSGVNTGDENKMTLVSKLDLHSDIIDVDFGINGNYLKITVSAPWILGSHKGKIICSVLDDGDDHLEGEASLLGLVANVSNIVNGVSFDITVSCTPSTWGRYKIIYNEII